MVTYEPDTCPGFDKRQACKFAYAPGVTPGSDGEPGLVFVQRVCAIHKANPRAAITENHFRLEVIKALGIDHHAAKFDDKRVLEISGVVSKLAAQTTCDTKFGVGKVKVL